MKLDTRQSDPNNIPITELECDGYSVFRLKITEQPADASSIDAGDAIISGDPIYISNPEKSPSAEYVARMLNYAFWLYAFHVDVRAKNDQNLPSIQGDSGAVSEISYPKPDVSFDDFSMSLSWSLEEGKGILSEIQQILDTYRSFIKMFEDSIQPEETLYALNMALEYGTAFINRFIKAYIFADSHFFASIRPSAPWHERLPYTDADNRKSSKNWRMALSYQNYKLKSRTDNSGLKTIIDGINLILFRFCQTFKDVKQLDERIADEDSTNNKNSLGRKPEGGKANLLQTVKLKSKRGPKGSTPAIIQRLEILKKAGIENQQDLKDTKKLRNAFANLEHDKVPSSSIVGFDWMELLNNPQNSEVLKTVLEALRKNIKRADKIKK